VCDRQVRDGLSVTARPELAPGPQVSAFRSGSGIYAFHRLPGMREWEQGTRDLLASPPETRRFWITVRDRRRRFLPLLFGVTLPLPRRGVYPAALGDAPDLEDALPGFYLVSAPTRPVAPGLTAVRARLVDHAGGRPAAFAVLRVGVAGENWGGIADARGDVAVLFPYPTVDVSLHTSPPGMILTPLHQQQWDLSVAVDYQPSALVYPDGSDLPELRSILQQSPANLWPAAGGPAVADWTDSLSFGRELVLRTEPLSELWIESS
jgi:hypothetical protein